MIALVITQIEDLLARPGLTDLLVNGSSGVWIDDGGGMRCLGEYRFTEPQVRQAARYLIARGGRHLDEAHPCLDVRVGEGIRVHAVLPPISTGGTLISVRVASPQSFTLESLVHQGMLTGAERDFIVGRLQAHENLIFAGATGSGKTTLLGAVMATVPESERIITVEDTAELRIDHPHVVGLETRQPNIEGVGEVSLDELVRQSLRMRPDRLVLGECRGAEFGTLLTALNTGHGGVGTTVHASSLEAVPARMEALGMLAGLSAELCARLVAEAFHVVLFLDRRDGVRRVSQLGRLELARDGKVRVIALGRDDIER